MSHVTGPGCVLVSLKFGSAPERGPWVTIRAAREALIEPRMNVDTYVAEVIAGVADANNELGTTIEIEEIEIVPDDFPTAGQVRHCARTLSIHYNKNTEQAVHGNTH